MNATTIRIYSHEGRTYTGFPVRRGDTIVFENDSDTEILRITIDKEDALVDTKGQGVDLIRIAPNKCVSLVINKQYPGGQHIVHYSATIGSSETEDPIIVIVE